MKNLIAGILIVVIIVGTVFGIKYEVDSWNKKNTENNMYTVENNAKDDYNNDQNTVEDDLSDFGY